MSAAAAAQALSARCRCRRAGRRARQALRRCPRSPQQRAPVRAGFPRHTGDAADAAGGTPARAAAGVAPPVTPPRTSVVPRTVVG
ncbi:hypothetical protein I552_5485 [Mycobacterium xenopi 3993]|nr:hypothetical protein I552_5485 [Mycobacterium xenopi 3993]